jgi:hypothetical protein
MSITTPHFTPAAEPRGLARLVGGAARGAFAVFATLPLLSFKQLGVGLTNEQANPIRPSLLDCDGRPRHPHPYPARAACSAIQPSISFPAIENGPRTAVTVSISSGVNHRASRISNPWSMSSPPA